MPVPPSRRVHIFGASGAGTSTLGRALADRHRLVHLDTDDFYWMPTDPPFTVLRLDGARPVAELVAAVEPFAGASAVKPTSP